MFKYQGAFASSLLSQRGSDLKQMPLSSIGFLAYSLVGIVAIFVPLSFGGSSTILIDHLVGFLATRCPLTTLVDTALLIVLGVVWPHSPATCLIK